MAAEERVVILGSGIIGLCSSLSLLSASPSCTVTLIENSSSGQIAPGASSQAGGFLAGGSSQGGWVGEASVSLARLSWQEHLRLAQELGGREKWGFRECGAVGLRVGAGEGEGEGVSRSAYRDLPEGVKEAGESWLEGEREDLANGLGGIGQMFVSALLSRTPLTPRVIYQRPSTLLSNPPRPPSPQPALHHHLRLSPVPLSPLLLRSLPHSPSNTPRLDHTPRSSIHQTPHCRRSLVSRHLPATRPP